MYWYENLSDVNFVVNFFLESTRSLCFLSLGKIHFSLRPSFLSKRSKCTTRNVFPSRHNRSFHCHLERNSRKFTDDAHYRNSSRTCLESLSPPYRPSELSVLSDFPITTFPFYSSPSQPSLTKTINAISFISIWVFFFLILWLNYSSANHILHERLLIYISYDIKEKLCSIYREWEIRKNAKNFFAITALTTVVNPLKHRPTSRVVRPPVSRNEVSSYCFQTRECGFHIHSKQSVKITYKLRRKGHFKGKKVKREISSANARKDSLTFLFRNSAAACFSSLEK